MVRGGIVVCPFWLVPAQDGQTTIPPRTIHKELFRKKLPTPTETYNSTDLSIVNSTVKQKKSKAMDMRLYLVKDLTGQGKFFVHWGPGKTNKADYFTKHHLPIHHTAMSHKYLHKSFHSIIFVPPWACINHRLGLTSSNMSREPRGPKSNRQEPGGSTSDCLTLVKNETFQKSNHK